MKKRHVGFWPTVLFLCALLFQTQVVQAMPGPTTYERGDINGDEAVNISDARMALQCAVGKIELGNEAYARADVDGDGKVRIADARLILQYAVGKITKFPPVPETYPVKEVNEIPEGQEVILKNVENLGHVPGWEPSEAVIVTSLDELRACGMELPTELVQKYDAAFFQENAIILMAIPVGNANVNHRIDSLVKTDGELCLGTTITWAGGLDVTERVTWRFAFEVNKSDVVGVGKITRYTFDEKDDTVQKPQQSPDINSNFSDYKVIVVLKRSYSTVGGVFIPNDFLPLDVEDITDLPEFLDSQKIEQISVNGDFQQSLVLRLTTKSKEHVLWAITVLDEMDMILYSQPSYIYAPAG